MDFLAAGVGAAAGISLAAGGCAYAAMWPGSQIFGDTLIAPRRPGEIALTFDDGPNPVWTPRLLDALAEHGARATFFMVGSHAQGEAKLVRQIAEAGHLIGNHSWSHPNLALISKKRIHEELSQTSEVLEQIIGARVSYFRPPFGARRPAALRIARDMGMVPVMWNAMTSDWKEPSAEKIAQQIAKAVERVTRRGSAANVVLHDGGHLDRGANREPSVTAAGLLCARYAKTHKFVTMDAWRQIDTGYVHTYTV